MVRLALHTLYIVIIPIATLCPREKLGRELECCREQVVGLEGEREQLQGAVKKYKDAVKEEKASIKVLEENQKVLTAELKKEMKLKEERDMKLKKAEEKMKKKELQLVDERSARELIDREVRGGQGIRLAALIIIASADWCRI